MSDFKLKAAYYRFKAWIFGQLDAAESWSDDKVKKIQEKQKEIEATKAKAEKDYEEQHKDEGGGDIL